MAPEPEPYSLRTVVGEQRCVRSLFMKTDRCMGDAPRALRNPHAILRSVMASERGTSLHQKWMIVFHSRQPSNFAPQEVKVSCARCTTWRHSETRQSPTKQIVLADFLSGLNFRRNMGLPLRSPVAHYVIYIWTPVGIKTPLGHLQNAPSTPKWPLLRP